LPPGLAALPQPAHNPSTEAGVALGRQLFFDPALSGNNRLACASCHQPARAFTDGQALSQLGASGRPLKRNVPTLANLAWAEGLFWDGGAKNLESLVFGPLRHPDELAQDLAALPAELARNPTYPPQFAQAFGTDSITLALLARALAQYQRSLLSFNSRYDAWQAGRIQINDLEMNGWKVFNQHCSGCHPPPRFTDDRYHNTGLDTAFTPDHEGIYLGRERITGQPADRGRFKTPTLRNLARTAPYFHDGRAATLPQVLAHYHTGVRLSPTLDSLLRPGPGKPRPGLALSLADREALLAFLATLNDEGFGE
jgi:cytochrome c peroxidase